MSPVIIDLDTYTHIDPTKLFGKEAKQLLEACNMVCQNWLYKYEGCYRSPSRPSLREVLDTTMSTPRGVLATYKAIVAEWEAANPEEAQREKLSRKEWEEKRDKQFRVIYGIARRHGLYLEWYGSGSVACYGDQWAIYKNGKRIGRIQCI